VVLNDPLVALESKLGGLGLGASGSLFRDLFHGTGGNDGGAVGLVLRLHVICDFLQTCCDALTLVQRAEHGGHVSTLGAGGSGGSCVETCGRGGRGAWGRGSACSWCWGGCIGGGGVSTLGVPGESCGVVVLNVCWEFLEEGVDVFHPINLVLVAKELSTKEKEIYGEKGYLHSLELFQNSVRIKFRSRADVIDKRSWCGGLCSCELLPLFPSLVSFHIPRGPTAIRRWPQKQWQGC
jgi:hypothetical protein